MKKRWFKIGVSILLIGTLVGAGASKPAMAEISAAAQNASGTAVISDKQEVVYAKLSADGMVNGAYVVNRFKVTAAGSLTDYGSYDSVANLTNSAPLAQDGDAIKAQVSAGNFYYQGNMKSAELPWNFSIVYSLNGIAVEPEKLAGQSGKLEIRIGVQKNQAADSIYYDNYMLQLSLALDADKCSDITAPDATIANAGKNKAINYIVMPGKDADISITANVTDFSMEGIQIAGMPFSMPIELPDTSDMIDDMTSLSDAVSELNSGVGDLAGGADDLNTGVGRLVAGSSDFSKGLSALSGNSRELVQGSGQIDAALSAMAAALNNSGASGGVDLSALTQLPAGLRQMATGLEGLSGGLAALKSGYDTMLAQLDGAIMGIPDGTLTDADIQALAAAASVLDPAYQATLAQLIATYGAAQTAKGTYTYVDPGTSTSIRAGMGAVSAGLDGMASNLNTVISNLNNLADTIETSLSSMDIAGQIQQLASGLSTLSANYGKFHAGLVEYTNGVGQIASSYSELNNALVKLDEGTGNLADGTQNLYGGTTELNDAVIDLPDTVQKEIDKLTADYDKSGFTPISFMSDKNHVSLVQFVLTTESIKTETKTATSESGMKEMTVWDRLLALFK